MPATLDVRLVGFLNPRTGFLNLTPRCPALGVIFCKITVRNAGLNLVGFIDPTCSGGGKYTHQAHPPPPGQPTPATSWI